MWYRNEGQGLAGTQPYFLSLWTCCVSLSSCPWTFCDFVPVWNRVSVAEFFLQAWDTLGCSPSHGVFQLTLRLSSISGVCWGCPSLLSKIWRRSTRLGLPCLLVAEEWGDWRLCFLWVMSQYLGSNVCPLLGVFPRTAVAVAQQEIGNLLKSLWGFHVIIFSLEIWFNVLGASTL